MPTYEYCCEGSDRIFEVNHAMALTIKTWKELCELGDFQLTDFASDTPIKKFIGSNGGLVSNSALKNPEVPPCATGGGCPGGGCGI